MNEIIFFTHILVLMVFILAALKLGKEALVASFVLQIVLANLFVTKQMVCFGLHVTCCDVYTVGALLTLNLLQEYYGAEIAKKTVKIVFTMLFFFVAMAILHLSYLPSSSDQMQGAFSQVLSSTPRVMAASFFVALLVQRVDIALFSWMKRHFFKQGLLLRFGGSALFSQALDTVLFTYLGLWGHVDALFEIIVMSYLVKVVVIATLAPMTAGVKWLVPKGETLEAHEL